MPLKCLCYEKSTKMYKTLGKEYIAISFPKHVLYIGSKTPLLKHSIIVLEIPKILKKRFITQAINFLLHTYTYIRFFLYYVF